MSPHMPSPVNPPDPAGIPPVSYSPGSGPGTASATRSRKARRLPHRNTSARARGRARWSHPSREPVAAQQLVIGFSILKACPPTPDCRTERRIPQAPAACLLAPCYGVLDPAELSLAVPHVSSQAITAPLSEPPTAYVILPCVVGLPVAPRDLFFPGATLLVIIRRDPRACHDASPFPWPGGAAREFPVEVTAIAWSTGADMPVTPRQGQAQPHRPQTAWW